MQTVESKPDLPFTIIYLLARDQAIPMIDFGSPQHGRLAYFTGDSVVIYIGATYGVTDVISEVTDDAPDLDATGWETIEEGSATFNSDLQLVPHDPAPEQIPVVDVSAGTYMVRISALGRDADRNDVKVRIQLWPTDSDAPLRTLKVDDQFDPNSIGSVIAQRHPEPAPADTDGVALPESDVSLLIRTDFSSDPAWNELVDRVRRPVEEFAGVEFAADVQAVNDTRNNGASVQDFVDTAAGDEPPFYVFVADHRTFADPENPILAIDLADNPGQTVRVPPEHMWAIENNLSLGNSDFADFIDSAIDGIYRSS